MESVKDKLELEILSKLSNIIFKEHAVVVLARDSNKHKLVKTSLEKCELVN